MFPNIIWSPICSPILESFLYFAQEKVFPFPEPLNEEQMATLNMLVEPVEKFFEDKGNGTIANNS